jgi:hypothetical protein
MTRLAVLLPPVALLVAGLAMLAVAPFAWGAAETIDFDDPVPTVIALIYAIPAILIGGFSSRAVVAVTRNEFNISWFIQPFGAGAYFLATVLEVALCFRVADSATYAHLRNASGDVTATQAGLLATSAAPAILLAGLVTVFAYAYCQSLTPVGTRRFDRQPDEPDMIEALMEAQMRNRGL